MDQRRESQVFDARLPEVTGLTVATPTRAPSERWGVSPSVAPPAGLGRPFADDDGEEIL